MSDVDFRELLVQGRVPAAVADALVTAGLNLELFGAIIAVSVDALETELARWVDAELLESEGGHCKRCFTAFRFSVFGL